MKVIILIQIKEKKIEMSNHYLMKVKVKYYKCGVYLFKLLLIYIFKMKIIKDYFYVNIN